MIATIALLATTALADPPRAEPLGPIALRSKVFGPSSRPRVVNLWATWCGPCVAEIPHLVAYASAHPEVEVVMIDLDMPKVRTSKVDPFLRDHNVVGITHYQLDHPDPTKAIYELMPDFPDTVPITLVVDRSGTIEKRFLRGLSEQDLAQLP